MFVDHVVPLQKWPLANKPIGQLYSEHRWFNLLSHYLSIQSFSSLLHLPLFRRCCTYISLRYSAFHAHNTDHEKPHRIQSRQTDRVRANLEQRRNSLEERLERSKRSVPLQYRFFHLTERWIDGSESHVLSEGVVSAASVGEIDPGEVILCKCVLGGKGRGQGDGGGLRVSGRIDTASGRGT